MAEDKIKVIEIKTGPAIKNIQDLKNNIEAFKKGWKDASGEVHKGLNQMEIGSAEYKETLNALQESQAALKNAMYGTAASFDEVMDAATAANVAFDDNNKLVKAEALSYNELVRELAILKEEWRSTTNVARRDELTKQIDSVNNRLKAMDESVGVFGRNVGNYMGAVKQLTENMKGMGGAFGAMAGPIGSANTALKAFSANPAMGTLNILATILQAVINALKSSEENTKGLTAAMAPLQSIGDAVTKVLQALGKAVVWLVEQFGKLTAAIFKNNDATNARIQLAEKEQALIEKERQNLIDNANAEKEIAQLRAQATEKNKYTATERIKFLEEAGQKEKEIWEREKQAAQDAYDALKLRTSLTESSKEELDALAAAEAKKIKAETDYYKKVREINAGITSARNEEAKAARDAAKAKKDEATAKIAAEKDYLSALLEVTENGSDEELRLQNEIAAKERDKAKAEATQKIKDRTALNNALALIDKKYQLALEKNQQDHDNKVLDQELLSIANRRDALQKGSVEYAAAQVEYNQKALDGMKKQMDETDAEFKARQLAAQRALVESQVALNDALVKETTNGLEAEMAALRDGSVEQLAIALEIAKAKVDGLMQGVDESFEEFAARRLEAEKAVREAEDALEEGRIDQDRLVLENRMNALTEGSFEYLAAALELKQFELDSLHQLEGESEEEFRARQIAAEKEYLNQKKALWQQGIAVFQGVASATSGILGSIADMYEADTDATEAEQKKAKNLRIAGATIDMLSGVVSAISTAQQLGPIAGPIMAAINSAAVIAAGIANISKIKSQQISKNGGGSSQSATPAVVSAPAAVPEVNEVRTITGASEEERLNQMASPQRVYILSSDLEADREANRVQVEETTF